MALNYYQKREAARDRIAVEIREKLMSEFAGLPVTVLRRRYENTRKENKALVASILKDLECEDYAVTWRVFFDIEDGEDGMARISGFYVNVEPTT